MIKRSFAAAAKDVAVSAVFKATLRDSAAAVATPAVKVTATLPPATPPPESNSKF